MMVPEDYIQKYREMEEAIFYFLTAAGVEEGSALQWSESLAKWIQRGAEKLT